MSTQIAEIRTETGTVDLTQFFGGAQRGMCIGVLSLCVWRPEKVSETGRHSGGQQNTIAYSSWLRFFSPLSHSWNGGEL